MVTCCGLILPDSWVLAFRYLTDCLLVLLWCSFSELRNFSFTFLVSSFEKNPLFPLIQVLAVTVSLMLWVLLWWRFLSCGFGI